MNDLKMTQGDFAKFLGISASILSSIYKGRTNPSLSTVMLIKEKVPDISYKWLIDGAGEMYETDAKNSNGEQFVQQTNALASNNDEIASIQQKQVTEKSKNGLTFIPDDGEKRKNPDKVSYRVTEIRVFFDDSHFETFVPSKT